MSENSDTRALPKRCTTCGGKGFLNVPVDTSGKTERQTCTDCIDGTTGFVVFNE